MDTRPLIVRPPAASLPEGPSSSEPESPEGKHAFFLFGIGATLVLITLAAYWNLTSNGFIWQDDGLYVYENARVRQGLTPTSVAWAFTTTHAGNWHPVTWLSHMLDIQFFGLDAGQHHLISLLIHALNSVLLFFLLFRMTGARWRSAFVASLFALHPLHVESVAWIAERKDLLSTLFWMLTLGAWLRFVKTRKAAPYALALLFYALGLMSKPMPVTLPFTLLLLDYWPLRRLALPLQGLTRSLPMRGETLKALLWEKAPLFAMAAASCIVTTVAQQAGMAKLAHLPLSERAANALQSYAAYLGKMVWPSALAIFYPHTHPSLFAWPSIAAFVLLAAVTTLSLRHSRRAPYLLVGWLWYLGTLVPVIGLVQVGDQAMADRYTYIPLIGIFIAVAWGAADLVLDRRALRGAAIVAAVGTLAALTTLTRTQSAYWVDTRSLFGHALSVTSDNWLAHNFLGLSLALSGGGNMDEAVRHFEEALRIDPKHPDIHNNMAMALRAKGRAEEAIAHYREALRLRPGAPVPLKNLCATLLELDRIQEAVECLEWAVLANPGAADVRLAFGQALDRAGRLSEALEQFEVAWGLDPRSSEALIRMGNSLGKMGLPGEAVAFLEKAVALDRNSADARINLGVALDHAGRTPEAIEQFGQALRIDPDSIAALDNLGLALGRSNRIPEAIELFRKAVRLAPDTSDVRCHLGIALVRSVRPEEALEQFREALRINPENALARSAIENILKKRRRDR